MRAIISVSGENFVNLAVRSELSQVLTRSHHFTPFRHHVFVKTGHKEVQLAEVGPRFEMKRQSCPFSAPSVSFSTKALLSILAYEIRLGTIEQEEADKEWVLAHYTRTSKKRKVL